LGQSACAAERELGAKILGQLGVPERVFPEEAVDILLAMLAAQEDEDVLSAVAIALGHQHDARAIEPLIRLKDHPSAVIRHDIAYALAGHEDDRAIQTLIELSADPDEHVRDWATFALGRQIDTDSPAIREALTKRLDDGDEETRAEAWMGLARRGDARVVAPILKALHSDSVSVYAVEAAGLLHDSRFFAALLNLRGRDSTAYLKQILDESIENCRPVGQ
jgi:HEAT repeat protein